MWLHHSVELSQVISNPYDRCRFMGSPWIRVHRRRRRFRQVRSVLMALVLVVGVTCVYRSFRISGDHSKVIPSSEIRRCTCQYFDVRLAGTHVRAYNASRYSDSESAKTDSTG